MNAWVLLGVGALLLAGDVSWLTLLSSLAVLVALLIVLVYTNQEQVLARARARAGPWRTPLRCARVCAVAAALPAAHRAAGARKRACASARSRHDARAFRST